MKRHRNFLIFYSFWLSGIIGIFVVFGEERPDEYLKEDHKICTVTADHLQHTKTKAYDKKACQLKEL